MDIISRPTPHEVEKSEVVMNMGVLLGIDSENELRAYINIARQIGFHPRYLGRILRQQLLSFFDERKVKLFYYREVHLYLFAEAYRLLRTKEAYERRDYRGRLVIPVWCWRPLRIQDCGPGWTVRQGWEVQLDVQYWGNPHICLR